MFMGVGLGPDSYAIIEQGRIGQILSTKPMERRAIIEEAAGVTKFKTKKRLAEAKLESSKINLSRVNDIVVEVEKQLGSLKRQAAKARRYSEIREQMRAIVRQMLAGKARELEAEAERIAKQEKYLSVELRGEKPLLARRVIVAIGRSGNFRKLGVPGEDLPHVSHYYSEPHAFWKQDVVVIGGKNSAVEAALDLYRNGARVTLVHRGKELGATIKYWVRPDIENRIKAGQIRAFLNTRVEEITKDEVVVENHAQTKRIAAKQVFALTGYHPDYSFMEAMGVKLDPESKRPALDPNTLESNVPGIHLAGVVIGGRHTGEIFIENGRFHGKQIVEALKK